MIKNINLEICPEIISHLQNDKNNAQANCLNINESGYELKSRDPAVSILMTPFRCHPIHIYKKSYILLRIGSSNWYISNKKLVAA